MYEAGRMTALDKNGKQLPLEKDESFQKLKRQTPSDFRKITARTASAAIAAPLAERIAHTWQKMLLDAERPKEPRLGADGETYHFSMSIQNRGIISAEIWSPNKGSKTSALVDLAHALSEYARRRLDAEEVSKSLKPFE